MPDTVKIFVSYSHQDSEYLAEDSLLGFLKGLQKDNVEFWTDRRIRTGELWDEVIKANIQDSHIALALVSQGFLDSEYCQNVEIRDFLARKAAHLFPIILSPCEWQDYDWLAKRQYIPGGDETIEEHYTQSGARKRLFLEIRKQLQERIKLIRQDAPMPAVPMTADATDARGDDLHYTAQKQSDFYQHLGDDWQALAEYFAIPVKTRSRFAPGQEARGVWDWLAERNRLADLREALEFIERQDLLVDTKQPVEPSSRVTERCQPSWKKSPYPGLRHFTQHDAPIFFGRGAETGELIDRLATRRFTAVVGASGSGKSSLVAAGLIPRLAEIAGGSDWRWVRFTPGGLGDDPFMALAAKLEPQLEKYGWQARDIVGLLRSSGELAELAGIVLEDRPSLAELLLFIDQFEELFTLTAPEHHRRFIAMLTKAARAQRVRIVLTLRADFYHRCVERPELAELLRNGSFSLAAPGVGALHEMIARPAERAGLRFEDGLVQRILNDTGTEPGALPLMAFALAELYKKAGKAEGKLAHAAYDEFDGVQGAIGKQAEDTFRTLDSQAQAKLGNVFRELVEVDEQGTAMRRRTPLAQLTDSETAKTLIKALTDARLLVTSKGESGDAAIVEVAHEALFKSWPRLADWIEEIGDDLRLRRQIRQAAADWEKRERKPEYRWLDERVVEVVEMLEHLGLQPDDFTEIEQDFLGPLDRDRMLEELEKPATPHERRATIGVRLSLLGDPRPGVGLREDGLPDLIWCQVPGGKIELEEVEGAFTVEPFYIAKYPITWIQYRAFLEASDGVDNSAWWQGLWFQVSEPHKQFNRRDNHPVESVCWLEVVAYCRWLGERLGYEIRLPTEWEWQQAATGGNPANDYPWGPDWDSGRTNTYESDLNRSTAVGIYPHGASPVGALDLSGNVLEWCLNEYDNPERVDPAGEARRVVRGGSWYGNRAYARAPARDPYAPAFAATRAEFGWCVWPPSWTADH